MAGIKDRIQAWATTPRPVWNTQQIRHALLAQREGHFQEVAQLYDSLWEDDELPGTLQKRVNATLRAGFRLKIDGDDRDLNEAERAIQRAFPQFAADEQLFDLVANWIMLGVGVATIDWDTTGGLWTPKLRVLPAEFLEYREHEQVWIYHSREGEQVITPGDGKWVLMTAGERGWIKGLIRGLAFLWYAKALAQGDWQRYSEKHGNPIFKVTTPIYANGDEKEEFVDALGELQSEGVIATPKDEDGNGYDVELLEATTLSWEGFKAFIERADRKMQVMLLGGNLGTEVATTGANRAAAEVQALNLDREKAMIDAKQLSVTLREQLLKPFMRLNFGETMDVPTPFWDVAPAEDVRGWVAAQTQFAELLNRMTTSGFKLDNAEKLAQDYGMRLSPALLPVPGSAAGSAPVKKSPT